MTGEGGAAKKRRDPVGGLVGLLAVGIALAALPVAPQWPAADSATDVVRAYFVDHGRAFLLQTFVAWVGFIGFSRALIGLSKLVGDAGEREAALTGYVGTGMLVVSMVAGNLPWATLAYETPQSPDVVRALWNLGLLSAFNVAGVMMAIALFPLGVGLLRTKILPSAYTYLVLASAVIGVVLATCFGRAGPMTPNGPIGLLAIVSLTLVILIGSILLLRMAPQKA